MIFRRIKRKKRLKCKFPLLKIYVTRMEQMEELNYYDLLLQERDSDVQDIRGYLEKNDF